MQLNAAISVFIVDLTNLEKDKIGYIVANVLKTADVKAATL
jgi:hypothetical protein